MGFRELLAAIGGLNESEATELLSRVRSHLSAILRDDDQIPDDDWLIEEARSRYARPSDNDIEIDDDAIVSRGDDGAFVQAWVYVRYPDRED